MLVPIDLDKICSSNLTPGQKIRLIGFRTAKECAFHLETTTETLRFWNKHRPKRFKAAVLGALIIKNGYVS